jgi:hypothetical protein
VSGSAPTARTDSSVEAAQALDVAPRAARGQPKAFGDRLRRVAEHLGGQDPVADGAVLGQDLAEAGQPVKAVAVPGRGHSRSDAAPAHDGAFVA